MRNNVPIKTHKTLPHPIITPDIMALKNRINQLVNDPFRMRWNAQQRETFVQIQTELQEAYKRPEKICGRDY